MYLTNEVDGVITYTEWLKSTIVEYRPSGLNEYHLIGVPFVRTARMVIDRIMGDLKDGGYDVNTYNGNTIVVDYPDKRILIKVSVICNERDSHDHRGMCYESISFLDYKIPDYHAIRYLRSRLRPVHFSDNFNINVLTGVL